jgi:branched-chain amino acid transport system substrate-binding protein
MTNIKMETVMKRMHLSSALASVFVAAVGMAGSPAAQAQEPIRIAHTASLTGMAASHAQNIVNGIQLAIDEWNENGGILGRKLELLYRDDQLKPELGVSHIRDLIVRENADFILGPGNSSLAMAQTLVAKQYKKIFMNINTNSPKLTIDLFHPYYFTMTFSGEMEGYTWAELLGPNYKKVGFIGPDYEASHAYVTNLKKRLAVTFPDCEVIVEAWPKIGETDYTPYITRLMAAEPEAVYSVLWAGDLVAFIKQATPYGFFDKTQFGTLSYYEDLKALGDVMPEGVLVQMRAPFFAIHDPRMAGLVRKWREKYGDYPGDNGIQSYESMQVLAHAIDQAGSTDSDAVRETLENMTYQSLRGAVKFRAVDHAGTINSFVGKTVKVPEHPFKVMTDVWQVPIERVWPSPEEVLERRKAAN